MRHFDAWLLRDPYSIFHYYSTGRRWKETVRGLIQERKICAPLSLSLENLNTPSTPASNPINPSAHPISSQSTSPFLTKLPLEIRLMIYEYALGDTVVHLVQVRDKIRHVRCNHTDSSLDKNRRCCPSTSARWRRINDASTPATPGPRTAPGTGVGVGVGVGAGNMLYPHTHPSLPSNLSNSSLSLLSTCRTIYAEASHILYATSTFDVDDLTTFIAFSLTISPQHLNSIKRLTIQWTPVWQPMAGEEHKSSMYSHTHSDRLWTLFWTRVAALKVLEDLALSMDLGRFAGSPRLAVPGGGGGGAGNGSGVIGGNRLRLAVTEPWVAPILCVRGLKSFELGITARCDAFAKQVLQGELAKDAGMLRDHLRMVLCSERGSAIPELPGVKMDLRAHSELLKACAFESPQDNEETQIGRPRLAITAA